MNESDYMYIIFMSSSSLLINLEQACVYDLVIHYTIIQISNSKDDPTCTLSLWPKKFKSASLFNWTNNPDTLFMSVSASNISCNESTGLRE